MRFYLNIIAMNYFMYLVFKDPIHICIKFHNHVRNYVGPI